MLNLIWAVMILLAVLYGAFAGNMSQVTDAALDSAGEAISLCLTMAGVVALWMGLMEIARKAGLIEKLTRGIGPLLRFMFPNIPKGHPAGDYIATNIIANIMGLGWACTPAGLRAMEELAKLEEQRGTPGYADAGRLEGGSGYRDAGKAEVRHGDTGKAEARSGGARHWAAGRAAGARGGAPGTELQRKPVERRASNEMCTFLILNISSLQLIPVNMIAYRSQYGSAEPAAVIAPAIAATLFSSLVAVLYCKWKDRRRQS